MADDAPSEAPGGGSEVTAPVIRPAQVPAWVECAWIVLSAVAPLLLPLIAKLAGAER